jgi:hypothetical protein
VLAKLPVNSAVVDVPVPVITVLVVVIPVLEGVVAVSLPVV